ncbi:MAG: aminopeptidase [Chitinophagales bacterium]|nr:aminopeptidase [Chitinophagales bacterium]MDW8417996.1 aminopeptidase [Chitinophagales bacterium]
MTNQTIISRYAKLLVNYCLQVKQNDKIYISSTYLAEPLLRELIKETYLAGGIPYLNVEIEGQNDLAIQYGSAGQLSQPNPLRKYAMEHFDGYLNIRAPFDKSDGENEPADLEKFKAVQQANEEINQIYFERTGSGAMRRCLCEYPTAAGAERAQMSLSDYERFIYDSCFLYDEDPAARWLEIRQAQQKYVDYLNRCDQVHFKGPQIDVKFSVKGRRWINSDGRTNMPSGEIYSAPIEDSVNGKVYFSYPTIYAGKEVRGITLEIKDGEIVAWNAEEGKQVLDKVFTVEGARRFGEVAVGCNYHIQRATRNILFDEKIGGSIHMAVGQSYKQCGGLNRSVIHWDMITDMKNGGEIWADGAKIYENGAFII